MSEGICPFDPTAAEKDPTGSAKKSADNNVTHRPVTCDQAKAARRLCGEQGVSSTDFVIYVCGASSVPCAAQADIANRGPSSTYALRRLP